MPSLASQKIRMGVNFDDSAWVTVGVRPSATEYRVTLMACKPEYLPADYAVTLVRGKDVLDHAEVRGYAHDAFIDAFGAM